MYFSLQVTIHHLCLHLHRRGKLRSEPKTWTRRQELKDHTTENIAYQLTSGLIIKYLIQTRPTCPGLALPTVRCILVYQLTIRKVFPQVCPQTILIEEIPKLRFPLSRCLFKGVKLTKKKKKKHRLICMVQNNGFL